MTKLALSANGARNKIMGVFCGIVASAMTATVALASDPWGGLFNTLDGVFSPLQGHFQAIAIPIAIAVSLFCLIMMLFSQNQKKVEMYRGWLIAIVVSTVIIFAIPYVISVAKTIGESIATGTPSA